VTPIQTSVQTNKLKPLFIGVVGGTASGKTSLCQRIEETLGEEVSLISLDSFYKGLSDEDHEDAANYNFDHPDALDFDLAYEKLNELIAGKDVDIPVYDFALHKRINQTNRIKTAPIIIFEGIHSISESRFRDLMDLKIFVLTPDDIRLKRRI
jgi:uridine kinase